jgi:hypothetical protein
MAILMYPYAINIPNAMLKTPLHIICSRWDVSMAQVLPTIRPTPYNNLNSVDEDGNTPFRAALLNMTNILLITPGMISIVYFFTAQHALI